MDSYVHPHADRAALLTVDVQRDFTMADAPATIPGTKAAVPAMQRLVERFRDRQSPIVHVVRLYRPDGSNVDRCRRRDSDAGADIVTPGSDGSQLVAELQPSTDSRLDADTLLDGEFQHLGENEWAMYKSRWSAFYDTLLESHLREQGIDTVVVCGCNFPNCPRTTVYDASQRDFRLVFVRDATSRTYERGMDELSDIGVAVLSTDETLDWLASDHSDFLTRHR